MQLPKINLVFSGQIHRAYAYHNIARLSTLGDSALLIKLPENLSNKKKINLWNRFTFLNKHLILLRSLWHFGEYF